MAQVEAAPFRFPIEGALDAAKTALVAIDMQVDFCAEGGLVHRWGVDLATMRAPIKPLSQVFAACRRAGVTMVHTRESYAKDLSDFPTMRLRRQQQTGVATGDRGPLGCHLVKGEPCWDFIPELVPLPGEIIVDKPGFGAFHKTDLEAELRTRGVSQLVLTGVTTNCCVASTLREAEDRGFECLVLADCCADPRPAQHEAAIDWMRRYGIFGTVASSGDFIAAIAKP
jgi:biuret amidohydrolase